MKKQLICLALAGAVAAPITAQAVEIADTGIDFYGSLRIMLEHAENADDTEYKDASSRIGLKGERDLGEGLKAFAKYEVAVNLDNEGDSIGDMRYGHLGLRGDWGAISGGKVSSPFYDAVGYYGDYMWWDSAPVYYTLDGGSRIGQSALYESPDLAGLKLKALVQIDDDDNGEEGQNQLGANYSIGKLTLGAAYTDAANNHDIYGVSASYAGNGYYINGAWMDREDTGSGFDALVGIPSGKNLYTVGVSSLDDDAGVDDFDAVILAYQRSLHKDVLVWVEAMAWDGTLYGIEDSNVIHVGMNFNF
ncbi:putative porin [Marinobacterium halophilum]|uniref:Putative porin n=1 Tax=Marinobacterium halophilum TaxID=267374 RepID=A0A2P8F3F1_9GAMM|nr:porin [Marinobacterium halophilum]PSL16213.1 putative porin [Marinobacterium halophilum]